MPKGIYRDGDWVQVVYDDRPTLPMHREDYEAIGYWPLIEDLMTKEQFEGPSQGGGSTPMA